MIKEPNRQAQPGIGVDVRTYSLIVQDSRDSDSWQRFDQSFPNGAPRTIERLKMEDGFQQLAMEVSAAAAEVDIEDARVVVAVPEQWRQDRSSLMARIHRAISRTVSDARIVSTAEAALAYAIDKGGSGLSPRDAAKILVCVAGDAMFEVVAFEVRQGSYHVVAYANTEVGTGEWDYDLEVGRLISVAASDRDEGDAVSHARNFRKARQSSPEWLSSSFLTAAEKFPNNEAFPNVMQPPRPTLRHLVLAFESFDHGIQSALEQVYSVLAWQSMHVCVVGPFSWHPAISHAVERYLADAHVRTTPLAKSLSTTECVNASALGASHLAATGHEVTPLSGERISMPFSAIRNGELIEAELSFGTSVSLPVDGFTFTYLMDEHKETVAEVLIQPDRPIEIKIGDVKLGFRVQSPISQGRFRVAIVLHPGGGVRLIFEGDQCQSLFLPNVLGLEAANG